MNVLTTWKLFYRIFKHDLEEPSLCAKFKINIIKEISATERSMCDYVYIM